MKQARTTMLAAVEKDLKERFADPEAENTWLFVAHSQNDEMAAEFAKEIEEHYPKAKPVYGAPLSLSIACHIGPGSLAEKAGSQLKGTHCHLPGPVWYCPHVSVHPDHPEFGEAEPDR